MNREFASCVHEAGHLRMAYDAKIEVKSVEIRRDKKTNDTSGLITMRPYMLPPYSMTREEFNQLSKERVSELYYDHLVHTSFFAAGYIAEFMFSGPKDFWIQNHDIVSDSDGEKLENMARFIGREHFVKTMEVTAKRLSEPEAWGSVLAAAEVLRKTRGFDKYPLGRLGPCFSEGHAKPVEPEHDAGPLIKHITDEIYSKQGE